MLKREWLCWAAVALVSVAAAPAMAADTPTTLAGVNVVSAEEAKKALDSGVPMIDTRVAAEYAEKTVKGARSVPYKEKSAKDPSFDASVDQFAIAKLPSDKAAAVVLFCNGPECWKSYKASVAALKAGYTHILWMRGGMPEWSAKGLPTQ